MAELVYAFDLKSNGEIHMGSSPISGTKIILLSRFLRKRKFFITERSSEQRRK